MPLDSIVTIIDCSFTKLGVEVTDKIEDQRYKVGRKFFIHAPPFKGRRSKETGEFLSKRLQRITPPFHGAEAYQHSIYYFWWEFLRRHEGYKACCEKNGKGKYAKLYADFGNIHEHDDFWKWWSEKVDDETYINLGRGERLFAEPQGRSIEVADRVLNTQTVDTLTVNIPLEIRTAHLVKNFRRFLAEHKEQVQQARRISRARYPISSSVRLNSLYQTLCVFDVEREYGKTKKQYEKCDLAGVYVNEIVNGETVAKLKRADLPYNDVLQEVRRRKSQAYRRYLDMAHEYIENVGKGKFPLRSSKDENKTAD